MSNFNVQYFINKFEAIPEELWRTQHMGSAGAPRCALGHCNADYSFIPENDLQSEAQQLKNLLNPVGLVAEINDALKDHDSLGPTPKQRILNALKKVSGSDV